MAGEDDVRCVFARVHPSLVNMSGESLTSVLVRDQRGTLTHVDRELALVVVTARKALPSLPTFDEHSWPNLMFTAFELDGVNDAQTELVLTGNARWSCKLRMTVQDDSALGVPTRLWTPIVPEDMQRATPCYECLTNDIRTLVPPQHVVHLSVYDKLTVNSPGVRVRAAHALMLLRATHVRGEYIYHGTPNGTPLRARLDDQGRVIEDIVTAFGLRSPFA